MGLLTKLKSLLGFEDDRSQVRRGESGVTIEREPEAETTPDAETESAVKGVDAGAEESFEPDESATDREETATEPEASEPDETGDAEADTTTPEGIDEAESKAEEGEPLEDVKGIGPAYAERLREAGIDDVADLATADADRLADETEVSAKRISTWIERAKAR